jgi:hypothetical protein
MLEFGAFSPPRFATRHGRFYSAGPETTFPLMMRFLRRHRQWLMIVIAILALPFIFYFTKSDFSAMRTDQFAKVYGRDVSAVEAQRGARLCNLARNLGMVNLIRTLASSANSEDEMFKQFILNRLVLHHEAARLGIRPTQAEIVEFVRNLRSFRNASGFDAKKFDEFTQTVLPSMGFSEAQIEELAADELSLNKLRQLVASGVNVPDAESKREYQQLYGMLSVSAVRLHAPDFAKEIKLTDDDVRKYYEAHKAELKTDEKRKVEFVSLDLTPEQKKLTGKERIDVLQKLADRANDFTQALLEKGADFHQVAAKFQLPVEATGEFTSAAPDPKLKADPQLSATAFQLTPQEPSSDAIQAGDGFYVLHLAGMDPARPLSVEEAKSKIEEAIKTTRARELMTNKGAQVAHDLRESLAAGEPLSSALGKLNAKAEKIEPFSLAEDLDQEESAKQPKKRPPDFVAIENAVVSLQPNDVSDFMPWEDGGVVVVLEKRELPDESKFAEKKAKFDERILTNKREIVFREWLHERQLEAGIVAPAKG